MEFETFLREKKIDPEKFKASTPAEYHSWEKMFNQIHADSFAQQKLFLINKIRRANPMDVKVVEKKEVAPKAMRPKIKPLKPKTS